MISRIRRVPLPYSAVCNHTSSATATLSHLPRYYALNLPQRSSLFYASTSVLNRNTRHHHVVSFSSAFSFSSNKGSRHPLFQLCIYPLKRQFGSRANGPDLKREGNSTGVRISSLLSKHMGLSRRQSERMILTERVTLFGKIVTSPTFELYPSTNSNQNSTTAMKVDGKLIPSVENTLKVLYAEQQQNKDVSGSANIIDHGGKHKKNESYPKPRIWLANKLKGELITEDDPVGRPSMLQRLIRGGIGKSNKKNGINTPLHLKPIGRLDMMTEGLMIFTNDGKYARQLELPANKLWRTYRVRVHGRLTMGKLRAMRKGLTVHVNDNMLGGEDKRSSGEVVKTGRLMKYKGIKVSIERKNGRNGGKGGTNTWLRITCTEGKNRQLRRILGALGLDVTRLIRTSYGDYDLNTIPPGMVVEVPCKVLDGMNKKGCLFTSSSKKNVKEEVKDQASAVQWINYS